VKTVSFVRRKFNAMLGVATVTMAVNFLVTLVGSLIAGNIVGAEGLAGLNVCTPVFAIGSFFGSLFSVGSGLVFSQSMGAFDERRAAGVWSQTLAIAVGIGLLFGVLMIGFGGFFMDFVGVTGAIRLQAEAYWRWQALQMTLAPIILLVMSMVYSDGDSTIATVAGVVYVVGTVVFGSLLTWVFGNAGGVSLGTSLAMIGVLAVCAIHFFRANNHLRFVRSFSWRDLRLTVAGSAPDATIYLCWGLLILIVNRFTVAVLDQQELLAVVALGASVVQFSIVFDGIGEALIPLGGMYAGEKNNPALRELAYHSAMMAVLEGVLFGVLAFVFAPQICPMYGFHGDNAALLPEAVRTMRTLALAMPFMGFLMMANTHYLIVGYMKFAVSVTVLKDFVFPCLAALVLGSAFGFRGLWYGFVTGYVIAAAYPFVFVRLVYGTERFPWLVGRDGRSINFAIRLEQRSLVAARDRIADFLREGGVGDVIVNRVMYTVEENGVAAIEKNRRGSATMEFFVSLAKTGFVRLVVRDDGVAMSTPFRLFSENRYLNTLNCNRTEHWFKLGS